MSHQILIVDDDQNTCDMLVEDLQARGYGCTAHTDPRKILPEVLGRPFDVVLTDLNMPGMNGIELCRQIAENMPDLPVVVITAFGSMESAVAAIRAGAYDFVTKPFEMDLLALTLERAIRQRNLSKQVKLLNRTIEESKHMDDLIGSSPVMKDLFLKAGQIAASDTSVLITGETGTGKELLARAIHARSARGKGPFVPVNCPALPDALIESELFGHARGAFTDARADRKGLFLQADGGTIFLDEIGDLPLNLQAKLLRVLEDRSVRPVGSDTEIPFDARIIAATNRDLEEAVEEGRFREDLYFRINVVTLAMPPLRARGGDILFLAQHFVERFGRSAGKEVKGLSEPVAEKLISYSWPGNVRELRNAVERSIALTRHDTLLLEDLPDVIRHYQPSHVILTSDNPEELIPLDEIEKRYILHVLKATDNNRTTAARILGLDRKTLYRKLQHYGL